MCNIGSFRWQDNINPFDKKGAITPAHSLPTNFGKNLDALKTSLKKPPGAPPAPIAPIAPATPTDSSVLQTQQDVRREAAKRRGYLGTLFGGDTGGYRPNNGPSVAGGGQGSSTFGG